MPFEPEKQTRTAETEGYYHKIATQLLRRYERETRQAWKANPVDAARWLREAIESRARSTHRKYVVALRWFLFEYGYNEAAQIIDEAQCKGPRKNSTVMHHLPRPDLDQLVGICLQKKGKYDELIGQWMVANYIVGLRPCEWERVRFGHDGRGEKVLVVENAKTTNGRGLGKTRTLLLEDLAKHEIEAIGTLIQRIRETMRVENLGFDRLQQRCSERLHVLTRKLWPRRKKFPTLYSCRHQLTRDLRSSGVEPQMISALLGHSSDYTAPVYYGRAGRASGRSSHVGVDAEAAASVRKVYKHVRESPVGPKSDTTPKA